MLLSLQSVFSDWIILACVAGGFSVCFFILWFAKPDLQPRESWTLVSTENNGGGGEGRRPLFESSIYYTHESANTHNVNKGDKSVWYIFLYTGNTFYVYITNQTNWVMIYTWLSTSLQTFYFLLLVSANNVFHLFCFWKQFFPGFFIPPCKK